MVVGDRVAQGWGGADGSEDAAGHGDGGDGRVAAAGVEGGAQVLEQEALVAGVVRAAQGRVDGALQTEAREQQVVAPAAAQHLVEGGGEEPVDPAGDDRDVGLRVDDREAGTGCRRVAATRVDAA